jgi:ADP-ribose pyrophosphatase
MKIISRRTIHVGHKWTLSANTLENLDGVRCEREFIDHPGSVAIVPLLEDDRVVLVRQFRHALGTQTIELPAGTCARGEDPLVTAQRELTEETGFRAASWRKLFSLWPAPGLVDEVMHFYLAEELTEGAIACEIDEEIEIVAIPLDEALRWIDDGRIMDSKSIVGLWRIDRMRAETDTMMT